MKVGNPLVDARLHFFDQIQIDESLKDLGQIWREEGQFDAELAGRNVWISTHQIQYRKFNGFKPPSGRPGRKKFQTSERRAARVVTEKAPQEGAVDLLHVRVV